MSPSLFIVDVFAEQRYAGNPLAVVVAADPMPEATMQRIAAEMNFSDTAFVSPDAGPEGGHVMRIFTPVREVAFGGHPVLGAAWVIRHGLGSRAAQPVRLDLPCGQVAVAFEPGGAEAPAWLTSPQVTLGDTCPAELIAPCLGLAFEQIDPRTPVQRCSAGTAAMLVPLLDLAALRRSRLDLEAYAPLRAAGFPPLIYLFCTETRAPRNDFSARFFFEAGGVREDPATGNGAAFLGAYLCRHRWFADHAFSLRIEQGHEIDRPSLVMLRADGGLGSPVQVGGRVIPVARGELLF